MNPGLPSPQAGVIIRKVLKIRSREDNNYSFQCKDLDTKQEKIVEFNMSGFLEAADQAFKAMKSPKDIFCLDLDLLISAASKRMATLLGRLKETFADPSEILRAEWIDLKDNVLSINHPMKGHLPGKYELTPRLTCMLNALARKNKRIFPTTYRSAYDCLRRLRTKSAAKFQNPALLNITFKSFRH